MILHSPRQLCKKNADDQCSPQMAHFLTISVLPDISTKIKHKHISKRSQNPFLCQKMPSGNFAIVFLFGVRRIQRMIVFKRCKMQQVKGRGGPGFGLKVILQNAQQQLFSILVGSKQIIVTFTILDIDWIHPYIYTVHCTENQTIFRWVFFRFLQLIYPYEV